MRWSLAINTLPSEFRVQAIEKYALQHGFPRRSRAHDLTHRRHVKNLGMPLIARVLRMKNTVF